jgi:hypothetical protein
MDPGFHVVTYSQSEKIGLPNWSFVKLFASAQTTVPLEYFDATFNYFQTVVNIFIKERAEVITRALNMWAGIETTIIDQGSKDGIVPQGIPMEMSELVFSMTETVGLPEKSSIDIFGAVKTLASAGAELAEFEQLAHKLSTQMSGKRDLVLANPRPWTAQK